MASPIANSWRNPTKNVQLVGENKSRELLEQMIKDGFVEEYVIPGDRSRYVKGTEKLYKMLMSWYSSFVHAYEE